MSENLLSNIADRLEECAKQPLVTIFDNRNLLMVIVNHIRGEIRAAEMRNTQDKPEG